MRIWACALETTKSVCMLMISIHLEDYEVSIIMRLSVLIQTYNMLFNIQRNEWNCKILSRDVKDEYELWIDNEK